MALDLQTKGVPTDVRVDFNTYSKSKYIIIKFVTVTMNGKTFEVY